MAHISSIETNLYHWNSRDRIVVSTLRCGRSNPGSNPGHGNSEFFFFLWIFQEHFISFPFHKQDLFHLWKQNWGQGIWQGLFNNTFFWKRLRVKKYKYFYQFEVPLSYRDPLLPASHHSSRMGRSKWWKIWRKCNLRNSSQWAKKEEKTSIFQ